MLERNNFPPSLMSKMQKKGSGRGLNPGPLASYAVGFSLSENHTTRPPDRSRFRRTCCGIVEIEFRVCDTRSQVDLLWAEAVKSASLHIVEMCRFSCVNVVFGS
ncbi:Uncharacterized protein HZ326_26920 [Fusarium oxysporum f. sp. albedinis]|nr:Uncharacterized protein HZ326_26920 [Fusarium oxysporum f. sp. albedinis]